MSTWTQPASGRITSPFGPRVLAGAVSNFHHGTDLGSRRGPVYAARDGVVRTIWRTALGAWVADLRHPDEGGAQLRTRYIHMYREEITVSVGQSVRAGQQIGRSGASGTSAAHLHFEVLRNGAPIDPEPFMRARGAALGVTTVNHRLPTPPPPPSAPPTLTPPTPLEPTMSWDTPLTGPHVDGSPRASTWLVNAHRFALGARDLCTEILALARYHREQGFALDARVITQTRAVSAEVRTAISATQANLISAIKAVSAGETFDEAKLLAGVQSAARTGTEEANAAAVSQTLDGVRALLRSGDGVIDADEVARLVLDNLGSAITNR